MSYPSLQSRRTFDSAAQAVPVMDQLALELRNVRGSLINAIRDAEALQVKRGGHRAHGHLLTDLESRLAKVEDVLCSYGFMERKGRWT